MCGTNESGEYLLNESLGDLSRLSSPIHNYMQGTNFLPILPLLHMHPGAKMQIQKAIGHLQA